MAIQLVKISQTRYWLPWELIESFLQHAQSHVNIVLLAITSHETQSPNLEIANGNRDYVKHSSADDVIWTYEILMTSDNIGRKQTTACYCIAVISANGDHFSVYRINNQVCEGDIYVQNSLALINTKSSFHSKNWRPSWKVTKPLHESETIRDPAVIETTCIVIYNRAR
jgi:hypothetical protein